LKQKVVFPKKGGARANNENYIIVMKGGGIIRADVAISLISLCPGFDSLTLPWDERKRQ